VGKVDTQVPGRARRTRPTMLAWPRRRGRAARRARLPGPVL